MIVAPRTSSICIDSALGHYRLLTCHDARPDYRLRPFADIPLNEGPGFGLLSFFAQSLSPRRGGSLSNIACKFPFPSFVVTEKRPLTPGPFETRKASSIKFLPLCSDLFVIANLFSVHSHDAGVDRLGGDTQCHDFVPVNYA